MSMKELNEKQQHCYKKHNLRSSTKRTDLVHAKKIGHIAGANVKLSAETWCQNQIEQEFEIKEGKIDTRKEFMHQQGRSSKVLVICCVSSESDNVDMKLKK